MHLFKNYMYGAGGAPGGFQMSFGLGAFPFFPVFGTTLSFGQPNYTSKTILVSIVYAHIHEYNLYTVYV